MPEIVGKSLGRGVGYPERDRGRWLRDYKNIFFLQISILPKQAIPDAFDSHCFKFKMFKSRLNSLRYRCFCIPMEDIEKPMSY